MKRHREGELQAVDRDGGLHGGSCETPDCNIPEKRVYEFSALVSTASLHHPGVRILATYRPEDSNSTVIASYTCFRITWVRKNIRVARLRAWAHRNRAFPPFRGSARLTVGIKLRLPLVCLISTQPVLSNSQALGSLYVATRTASINPSERLSFQTMRYGSGRGSSSTHGLSDIKERDGGTTLAVPAWLEKPTVSPRTENQLKIARRIEVMTSWQGTVNANPRLTSPSRKPLLATPSEKFDPIPTASPRKGELHHAADPYIAALSAGKAMFRPNVVRRIKSKRLAGGADWIRTGVGFAAVSPFLGRKSVDFGKMRKRRT
jgi:hypothetical protein